MSRPAKLQVLWSVPTGSVAKTGGRLLDRERLDRPAAHRQVAGRHQADHEHQGREEGRPRPDRDHLSLPGRQRSTSSTSRTAPTRGRSSNRAAAPSRARGASIPTAPPSCSSATATTRRASRRSEPGSTASSTRSSSTRSAPNRTPTRTAAFTPTTRARSSTWSSDTIIEPGENGVLYTIKLNTKFDKEAGTLIDRPRRPRQDQLHQPDLQGRRLPDRPTPAGGAWKTRPSPGRTTSTWPTTAASCSAGTSTR